MKKMRRSKQNRVLLGVCGGLANYLSLPAWGLRLMIILFFILSAGITSLLYLLLALVMPEESENKRQAGFYHQGQVYRKSGQAERKEVEKIYKDE